eukprot:1918130-Rhodomonas_salina.1
MAREKRGIWIQSDCDDSLRGMRTAWICPLPAPYALPVPDITATGRSTTTRPYHTAIPDMAYHAHSRIG